MKEGGGAGFDEDGRFHTYYDDYTLAEMVDSRGFRPLEFWRQEVGQVCWLNLIAAV